jgi:CHAT domain-containing protein/tetratricopeptide (TPR) repeat protein
LELFLTESKNIGNINHVRTRFPIIRSIWNWLFPLICILTMSLNFYPASAADTGAGTSAELAELLKEANGLWLKGDATNGIPKYERLLGQIETAYGKDSPTVGLVLFRIGFLYSVQGDFEKALPNLERSLKLIESLPDDSQNMLTKANLYWGLGMSYKSLLKHEQAIQAFNQSLKLKEKLLGADDPNLVEILITLADLHSAQQRPLDAIPLLERALAISEKSFGSESLEAAQVLASLGNTWEGCQDYDAALRCLKRSLDIREKLLAPTNDAVAAALGNLGTLYLNQGRYSEALPFLERSVELCEKNLVPKNLQLAFQLSVALNNLAVAQVKRGDYEKGISTLQRSIAITETNFGSASINLVAGLNSMAVAFADQGNFERALPLLERAVRILEDAPAPAQKTSELVDGLNNLAELYRKTGDDDTALRLFNRSRELAENRFGSEHVSIGYALNGIALIFQHRGDTTKALAAFEHALAILEKNKRSQIEVPGILNNISCLLDDVGDTNRALSTLQMALTMQEKVLPPKNPAIATTLNNLAGHFSRRGNWAEAQEMYRKSLAITDAAFGKDNPDSCNRLESLAITEMLNGDWAAAFNDFEDAARRRRRYVVGQMAFGQNSGVSRIQEELRVSRDWCHSTCGAARGEMLKRATLFGGEQSAFGKALLEEVESVSARLAAEGRDQIRQLREQAVSIRKRLDAIGYRSEGAAWSRERVEWQNSEKDKFEQELKVIEDKIAGASELVAQTIHERDLSLADVAHCLPSDAVLLDFVQYRRTAFCCGDEQWKEQRYAVYLTFPLARDSTNVVVERVDLGEAAPINEAVELVCKRMSAGQFAAKDLAPALQQFSDLVYAPLAAYLTNVSHLIVCPDGQLSRLPFEMLPVGNKFLIEEKTISYVTSGREIVRIASPKSNVHSSKSLVMGNPNFNFKLPGSIRGNEALKSSSQPESQSLLTSAATRSLSRDYRGLKFDPLPGSGAEATNVAGLLGADATLRLGADAREAELKAVVSPRVLHLATHGFYLPDQEFKQTNGLNNSLSDFTARRSLSPPGQDWENPMVRCGIALAGANHAMQITNALAEDGLLTGLEASLLNLQGTELVILSACDSGTGEVKIGEGVMSLRRAFLIAGAKTVLASHWPVSDKATSRLMTEFMRRWQTGESRAAAWREAQLSLLQSKDFSNPYFWAAFTLTGEWQ